MKSMLVSLLCLTVSVLSAQSPAAVSVKDFAIAAGPWKGKLTYLDYTSGKPYTMPANITLRILADNSSIELAFVYPDEPKANGKDTLFISGNGSMLNKAKIISKKLLPDGSIQIITDINGKDGNDNKSAILRHIYTIGKNNFSNRKEVKFEGADQWIMRNEYVFSR
jgi:hypothetical protein